MRRTSRRETQRYSEVVKKKKIEHEGIQEQYVLLKMVSAVAAVTIVMNWASRVPG